MKLTNLLTPEQWEALYSCRDLESLMSKLRSTRYAEWVTDVSVEHFGEVVDTRVVEYSVTEIKRIAQLLPRIPSDIVWLMTDEYDIEHIKRGLRAWKHKVMFTLPTPHSVSGRYDIDWDIFNTTTSTLNDIIAMLAQTPFAGALKTADEVYRKTAAVFYLETALERDYFKRLWDAVSLLKGSDYKSVARLFGLQIDFFNIKNLIRCKLYFDVPADYLPYIFYPHSASFSMQNLEKAYETTKTGDLLNTLGSSPLAGMFKILRDTDLQGSAELMEHVLYANIYREVRLVLRGYPFTLAVPLAYCMLNRWEMAHLQALTWSIALGLPDKTSEIAGANPLAQKGKK
ncbi:V-type ATPase subunit [bacterium]|nr:V-type ATPase subunit [bacterium]